MNLEKVKNLSLDFIYDLEKNKMSLVEIFSVCGTILAFFLIHEKANPFMVKSMAYELAEHIQFEVRNSKKRKKEKLRSKFKLIT